MACAECLAGAPNDDDSHLAVGTERIDRALQLVDERRSECVVLMRSAERERYDPAFARDQELGFGCSHGHWVQLWNPVRIEDEHRCVIPDLK